MDSQQLERLHVLPELFSKNNNKLLKEISLCIYGQFRSWDINLKNNIKELNCLFENYKINIFILTDKQTCGNYSIENENKIKEIFLKLGCNICFIKYIEDFDLSEEEEVASYYDNNCKHSLGKNKFVPNLMYRKNLLNRLKNEYITLNNLNIYKHFYIRLFDMKIIKTNELFSESIINNEISGSGDSMHYGTKDVIDHLFNTNYKIYHDDIFDDTGFYNYYLNMDYCLCTLKHTYAPETQYAANIYYSSYKYINIRYDYNNPNNPNNKNTLFNIRHCQFRK